MIWRLTLVGFNPWTPWLSQPFYKPFYALQPSEPQSAEGPRGRAPGPPSLSERHPLPANRRPQRRPHRSPPQSSLHSALHLLHWRSQFGRERSLYAHLQITGAGLFHAKLKNHKTFLTNTVYGILPPPAYMCFVGSGREGDIFKKINFHEC